MNAIMALLTAASVLAHAALGCCIHHSHVPNSESPVGLAASHSDRIQHPACGHCNHHRPTSEPDHSPAAPGGDCGEQDCVAVAGASPTVVLKGVDTVFGASPLSDLLATSASSVEYVQTAGLQHDLGPPVRPHLFHGVLLI
jgi:hypothetical protein